MGEFDMKKRIGWIMLALSTIGYLIFKNMNPKIIPTIIVGCAFVLYLYAIYHFAFKIVSLISPFKSIGDIKPLKPTSPPPERPHLKNPQPKEKWIHRNGNVYMVLHIANIGYRNKIYPVTVVYKGLNGWVWTRPLSDWHRSMTLIHPFKTVI